MFQQLKRLGADTAIYGLSTILGRFLNFLLVPFYTNVLIPGDYGIVAYVYSLIAFVNVLYTYGMESAYFKYASTLEIGTKKQNFSTPFWAVLGTSVLFSSLMILLLHAVSAAINLPSHLDRIIYYTAGILAFDAMAIVPFAALRLERKSKRFATIKFLNIAITVILNIILLVLFNQGVEGIFLSGLIASMLTFVMLFPTIKQNITFETNGGLLKSLLLFGLPSIPAGLAAMTMQVIDRPILRSLTNDTVVGIYQANYRLGIFMMLVVQMYDYAWRPFYFSIAKESNAKEIFARVLTYLTLFMSGVFLVLTFFIEDIVKISLFGRHIIAPAYWDGLNIIPIVLLGYIFLGISTNLSAGFYIEKKTKFVPIGTFIGAMVNIVANYMLIPHFGMIGAAWATLFAYFAMTISVFILVERLYPVHYEFTRLMKIGGAVCVVMLLYALLSTESIILSVVLKFGLLVLFLFLMYTMRFFEQKELRFLQSLFLRNRSTTVSAQQEGSFEDERGV